MIPADRTAICARFTAANGGAHAVLVSRRDFLKEVRYGTLLLLVGLAVYLWRAAHMRQWPFTTRLR